MRFPHGKSAGYKVLCLVFFSLLCLQCVWSASIFSTRSQQDDQPMDEAHFIIALRARVKTLEELIQKIKQRGVSFKLTPDEEQKIRQVGRYLGRQSLDDLISYLRVNYRPNHINEPIELHLGTPRQIEYLGFKATYLGSEDEYYVITIQHPGTQEFDIKTREGCEHAFSWGGRDFNLVTGSTSSKEIRAVLAEKDKPSIPPGGRRVAAPSSATRIVVRVAPCVFTSMQRVIGNNTESPSQPMSPYYISEPLTIGILRHYAKSHTLKTRIPADAKDTDPITAIYYEDAFEIATMLGTKLPSLEQWINAFHAKVVRLTSPTELVVGKEGGLLIVQEADGNFPANTHLSSRIAVRKVEADGLAKGYLRVVRPVGNFKSLVIEKDTNTQVVP